MTKQKAPRNRTIDFNIDEGKKYLDRCLGIADIEADCKSVTICGDSLEVMAKMPKKSVDLMIVDPPYNLSKDFGGNTFRKMKSQDYEDYTRSWLDLALPLLKDTGTVYVCCDWQSSMIIGAVLAEKLIIRNRITWQREKGRGAAKNWKNGMEDIWYCTVSEDYTFNLDAVKQRRRVLAPYRENGQAKDWQDTKDGKFRDSCPSNFWDDISVPFWSMPENTAHPTQKPEKLIAKLILASSNEGDLVFDPFLGSGTTSVVAKKLDRAYIGIEKNEQYCAWAEYRLEQAEENKEIQGIKDGVFWERNSNK